MLNFKTAALVGLCVCTLALSPCVFAQTAAEYAIRTASSAPDAGIPRVLPPPSPSDVRGAPGSSSASADSSNRTERVEVLDDAPDQPEIDHQQHEWVEVK